MIQFNSRKLPLGLAPDEAASHWLVRMDQRPLDAGEQAAFEEWRAQSPANAEAFARVERAWGVFDDAEGYPHLDAIRESALAVGPEPRRGLWLGVGAGIAASLLAVFAIGSGIGPDLSGQRPAIVAMASPDRLDRVAMKPDRGDFATAKGEQKRFELADGSVVTLNTDSAMRVAYAPGRRMIRLMRGQALFEVAKNAARPFVVRAGDRQVTALGTVFQVRLDTDRMKVMLVEGKVVVDGIADRPSRGAPMIVPAVLTPGQELVAMSGAPQQLARVDVDQQLRWREGFVEFQDVPLAAAVREMNRYSDHQLVVADPATGDLRVSGVFRTGNPGRFAAIVGELLPVRSRDVAGDRIELSAVSVASR